MNTSQKYLKGKSMLLFLAFISAFPPLSTDLYLPALPQMTAIFNASPVKINLTLSLFFVFFAGGQLFWGPLSDKYGRKPVVLSGLVIYVIGSLLCGFSSTVDQLIIARIFQAFGGSAATAVSTAMVKDLYDGRERERVMAVIMSLVIIAPIVGPVFGALLLKYLSWRAGFLVLAGVGTIAAAICLLLNETVKHKYTGSVFSSLGRLTVVLKNPNFSIMLALFSPSSMFVMAFLAASSFIYVNDFGLSEQQYSYFLAFNAAFALLGPVLYLRVSKFIKPQTVITTGFALMIVCGLILPLTSDWHPALFALTTAFATLAIMVMRVPSTNLLLEQQQGDTGSASALINFLGMIIGSLGMYLVSLNSEDLIWTLGCIQLVIGLFGTTLWYVVRNKPFTQLNFQKS